MHHSFCVGCPTTRRSFTHLRAAVLGRHLVAIGALDTDMLAVADEYNALIAWRSEGRNTSSARHRLEACEVRGSVAPPYLVVASLSPCVFACRALRSFPSRRTSSPSHTSTTAAPCISAMLRRCQRCVFLAHVSHRRLAVGLAAAAAVAASRV